VQSTEHRSFIIQNPTSSLVNYEIITDDQAGPFEITPTQGVLKAGEKKEINISFSPLEAKVVISTAVFQFSEGGNTL
jgi:hypothetical protein